MKRNSTYPKLLAVLSTAILALQFQNCSEVQFSTPAENSALDTPSPPTPSPQPGQKTETFVFGDPSNKIDILIMVDDSGSMEREQQQLADGFNTFISSLAGIDWQIGVALTDPNNYGRLVGPADLAESGRTGSEFILKPTQVDVETKFRHTVQRTTSSGVFLQGSGDEQPIRMANLAIDGHNNPEVAQGLFRENSNLAIVILSDEDERSCGNDPNRAECINEVQNQYREFVERNYPESLIRNVATTFNRLKSVVVNAIVIKPNDSVCFANQNQVGGPYGNRGKYGIVISELVAMTAGLLGSICDNGAGGFTDDLRNISENIYDQINPETITLQNIPIAAPTVRLTVTDATRPATTGLTYTWDAGQRKIIFNKFPANTTVVVTYPYNP
jgi:hypothetical protein